MQRANKMYRFLSYREPIDTTKEASEKRPAKDTVEEKDADDVTFLPDGKGVRIVVDRVDPRAASACSVDAVRSVFEEDTLDFDENNNVYKVYEKLLVSSLSAADDRQFLVTSKYADGSGTDLLHPFFWGAFYAYDHHCSFAFSPDHIWQLVLEEWSYHVSENAEELRHCFVEHEGKKMLSVDANGVPCRATDDPLVLAEWERVIRSFGEAIRRNTTPELAQVVIDDPFSTSTHVEVAARAVSLMSACRHYFNFSMQTRCGFPSMTLHGTREDWVLLRDKVERLAAFMTKPFAEMWLPALRVVFGKIIDVYDSVVDRYFFGCMVKNRATRGSGATTLVSGWINSLFPRNGTNKWCKPWSEKHERDCEQVPAGRRRDQFGLSFCWAEVKNQDYGKTLTFKSGFVGCALDEDCHTITPVIAWGIVEPFKVPMPMDEEKNDDQSLV